MQQDLVSMVVSKELQAQLLQLIQQIKDLLPDLISLESGQRRSHLMMGPGSDRYVRVSLTAMAQNPDILPRSIDINAALADLEAMDNLTVVLKAMQHLTGMIEDTVAALGSDAMVTANLGYGLMQTVGKAAGLEEVVKELSYRHARKRRKKTTPDSPGE
ncbi:hypothetical protein [Noviluteimonas gilva]|uniref:Uncharacterized protein n=1 Tax=Noviluteimonas gilva TaxID=2682097 RepID=A0A7C9HK69_9GAMM|nr:hypothetical protein [Lysobacter gilvus]MUV12590.1 hypothetical protein [Lysobacter gilvus]